MINPINILRAYFDKYRWVTIHSVVLSYSVEGTNERIAQTLMLFEEDGFGRRRVREAQPGMFTKKQMVEHSYYAEVCLRWQSGLSEFDGERFVVFRDRGVARQTVPLGRETRVPFLRVIDND